MRKINERELHEIFDGLKNKNQNSYNELYEKYYSLVYGVAFSIMKNKDDSEDMTNEVFTKIYKLDKEKLPVSNEASWLFTVTRNECFSYLRKSRINISIDEIYGVASDSKEIQDVIDIEYYNKIISGLNEQEKTIVSLKVLSNFTFSKIAQVMNLPIGTVQWKYYKAINSLKVSIGGLAGAIIAFVLVIAGRDKFSNKAYLNSDNKTNKNTNSNIKESNENAEINDEKVKSNENVSESSSDNVSSASMSTMNNEESNGTKSLEDSVNTQNSNKESQSNVIENSVVKNESIVSVPSETKNSNMNWNSNTFTIAGISVGIALLIISLIFFKKYQQKLNRKTSK